MTTTTTTLTVAGVPEAINRSDFEAIVHVLGVEPYGDEYALRALDCCPEGAYVHVRYYEDGRERRFFVPVQGGGAPAKPQRDSYEVEESIEQSEYLAPMQAAGFDTNEMRELRFGNFGLYVERYAGKGQDRHGERTIRMFGGFYGDDDAAVHRLFVRYEF